METAIVEKIKQLKEKRNAVILAHFYTSDEIQEIADYVGDSFYLAKIAKQCTADVIVFCGVSFMGESAKILNPSKTVLMPDPMADCAMAHMASEEKVREMREKYEDLSVVCYINSTAKLKAVSDVCVTSSNAVRIIKALPNKNIFFIPDRNLGRFVAEQVPEKNIILNDGFCPIHEAITTEHLLAQKRLHPEALVLTHPECQKDVVEMSDFVGSTAEIIAYAKNSQKKEFIICTEVGVDYRLKNDNPDKTFYFCAPCPCCNDMKFNTLEGIILALESDSSKHEITVSDDLRKQAMRPLNRMLELAK